MSDRKPLYIALVIERFDPRGGGAERSTMQMAEEFVKRGHKVKILAGHVPDGVTGQGYAVEGLWCKKKRGGLGLLAFRRWAGSQLLNGGFDVSLSVTTAVAGDVIQPRSGTIKETLIRNAAAKHRWGGLVKKVADKLSFKRQMLLWVEKKVFKKENVKCVIALSDYVKRQVEVHYGFDLDKVKLIANAASMPEVSASQRAGYRNQVRKAQGFDDEKVTVFLFAAHNPMLKGAGQLLDAVKLIKDQGKKIGILVAGDRCKKMAKRVKQLGLETEVKMVGNVEGMAKMYCAADVTVHPTFYDPSSKVVIESLMLGVPAISTRYNGASDFIQPVQGQAGYGELRGRVVDEPTDVMGLATAMLELMDDNERARCANACEGLREQLSMSRHIDEVEAVLYRICEG